MRKIKYLLNSFYSLKTVHAMTILRIMLILRYNNIIIEDKIAILIYFRDLGNRIFKIVNRLKKMNEDTLNYERINHSTL